MNLLKTSFWNGISVLVRTATTFVLNKILAVYVGPAGYAMLGQFQNAIQMLTSFASGAINTGVVKYTAEYHNDESKLHKLWRTAGSITLCGSLTIAIFIVILSKNLAIWFLHDVSYYDVFLWLAGTITFLTFNALLLAILNGKKEVKWYVLVNIIGSIVSLVISVFLAINWGVKGALIAICINQSILFFVSFAIVAKRKWFSLSFLIGSIDKKTTKNLSKFILMALVSAVSIPLAQIIIRTELTNTLGVQTAGYWEAMIRLSSYYLMIITSTLSVYYLPRLSELNHEKDIKKEITQGYKLILPFCIICSFSIYLLRDFVIKILFSTEFLPMSELFFWQLIGDVLKIGSWLLAYLMLAKGMTKLYITTEIIFILSRVILSILLIKIMGVKGATLAYALNYLFYWIAMYYVLFLRRKKLL